MPEWDGVSNLSNQSGGKWSARGRKGVLARVETAFREKHGFSDRMAGLFRFGGARVMRLVAR